jgi:hypothetical protein
MAILKLKMKYLQGINPNNPKEKNVTRASLIGCSSIPINPSSSIIITSTQTFLFFAKVSAIIIASS